MRDLALVGMGMLMGLGLHEAAHLSWSQFKNWRLARKDGPQWFRPQRPVGSRPAPGPAQHPTPERIQGQRAAGGAHRPKQRQARFTAGRVRRTKAERPARAGGTSVDISPGESGGYGD